MKLFQGEQTQITASFSARKINGIPSYKLARQGLDIPKKIRNKWMQNKQQVSRFIDELDYNNQIQSSYDLTLLERQNKRNTQDVA